MNWSSCDWVNGDLGSGDWGGCLCGIRRLVIL